jgi:integrase
MSTPNVHGLPPHLRKDDAGYYLDYSIKEGGKRKRKRVRLGPIPLVQAKKILARNMVEMVEGKYLASEQAKLTFADAADSFLAYSKSRKKSHRNDPPIVSRFKAFFGIRSLESLTPDLVEAYIIQRQKEGQLNHKGKGISGTTLNKEIACLKTIVRRALLNGQINRNPIMGVRKFKEIPRDRTLSPEEYQTLIRECPHRLRPIIQLAYFTGMRCGEILGLKWNQLDLKNKVLILEALDTKTLEKREIPLSESLIGLLQQVPPTLGSPYVFTFKGKPMKSIKTTFKRVCRKAGIENFKFHDLRHCAVTNFRKAGVSDSVIMSISGHKTHAVFRRYDRVDREDREGALRKAEILMDTARTLVENQSPLEGSK